MNRDSLPTLAHQRTHLAVICPMANERNVAAAFVEQVLAYCRPVGTVQFFAVLDHKSRDGTLEIMKDLTHSHPGVHVVWAPENLSVVDAYMRGYHEALNSDADWILEIDCDFSHQPSDVPKFLAAMAQGYDCAFGSRFYEGGRISDSPFSRYVISHGVPFWPICFWARRCRT